jgi:hypothetical protein|tara:strand:- start:3591 stop:3977 length:387 start_codon:yes stop_codon:yes gene_type:complete
MSYDFTEKDLQDAVSALVGTPALELELNEWGNGTLKPVFDGKHNQEELLKQLLEGARELRLCGFSVEVFYQYLKKREGRYSPYPHGKVSRRLFSPVPNNQEEEEEEDFLKAMNFGGSPCCEREEGGLL